MEQRNNELMHYGVPGMKWGVRKAQSATGNHAAKSAKKKQLRQQGKTQIKQLKSEYKAQKKAAKSQRYKDTERGRELRAKQYDHIQRTEDIKNRKDYNTSTATRLRGAANQMAADVYRVEADDIYRRADMKYRDTVRDQKKKYKAGKAAIKKAMRS